MSEPTRLDWLREEHTNLMAQYATLGPGPIPAYREDIGYLLRVIHLLEEQIEAQALAHLDPNNQPEHHHTWTRTGGGLAPGKWLCRTCPAEGTWDGDDNTPIQETTQ